MALIKLEDEHALEIQEALIKNNGYCPCAIRKTPETKCMCLDFRNQARKEGWYGKCHCGLWEKVPNV